MPGDDDHGVAVVDGEADSTAQGFRMNQFFHAVLGYVLSFLCGAVAFPVAGAVVVYIFLMLLGFRRLSDQAKLIVCAVGAYTLSWVVGMAIATQTSQNGLLVGIPILLGAVISAAVVCTLVVRNSAN